MRATRPDLPEFDCINASTTTGSQTTKSLHRLHRNPVVLVAVSRERRVFIHPTGGMNNIVAVTPMQYGAPVL